VRVSAVDIGTNSTRLLIADLAEGRLKEVSRRVVVTGLGRGVDAHRLLSEEAIRRTVDVLASYGGDIEEAGVERARAAATSATRDAGNAVAFLDRAAVALGFRPDVVDGATEARLGFRGAVSGIEGPAPYLMIDPGGGSTEFVFGIDTPQSVHSWMQSWQQSICPANPAPSSVSEAPTPASVPLPSASRPTTADGCTVRC